MRILASDFDETIYFPNDEDKTKSNIEAIRKFINYGNIFCIVTGRNYCDLKKLLTEMNIPYSYLVCEDGAKIFNYVDYCIETVMLEEKEINQIIPILEEIKCDYYLDDGYSKTENKNDCVKIVVNCVDSDEKDKIFNLLKDKVDIHIYASRTHVNIIHKTVNKERGIKKLFNLEKLNYSLLKVIGDNDNDYQMIKEFHGVTVEKHHPILDELNPKVYKSLKDYIEELMKN